MLHLGGGALTLPRYVQATRPGSTQRVVEVDGALVELVRRELPWPADPRLRVRVADARATLESSRDAGYDVVVADVFAGARTPAHLTSAEYAGQVARVLTPTGWYLANLADGPPLRHSRAQVATVRSVLPRAALVGDAAVLRGRRHGNLVLMAGRVEPPVPELTRRAAGDWFPGRVLAGDELDRFVGGAAVVTDADATGSTPPPPGIFRSAVDPQGRPVRINGRRPPRGPADVGGQQEVWMSAVAAGLHGELVRPGWMFARAQPQSRASRSSRGSTPAPPIARMAR